MISGQCSDWKNVGDGVPQGSVLGPLLFLVYINDITSDLSSDCFLFADDTSMLEIVNETPEKSAVKLNNDLSTISKWSQQWLVTMNASKTRTITFTVKKKKAFHPTLRMNGKTIDEVFSHTHLGLNLTSNLSWKSMTFIKGLPRASKSFKIHSVQGWEIYPNKTGARQYTRAVLSKFAEIHSTHPISAYIFLLSLTLRLPPQFIDALFGVHVTGISGWNLWCVTRHTHEYDCDLISNWISFCSRVHMYLYVT